MQLLLRALPKLKAALHSIGQWIKTFPSHAAAYKTMYLVGGSVSLLSFLIFAFLVHPLDEPLDLSMQCKPLAARFARKLS